MRSSLCVMFCSFPRLFDGRFIASVFYDPAMKIGIARFNALCTFWRAGASQCQRHVCFCLCVHLICVCSSVRVRVCSAVAVLHDLLRHGTMHFLLAVVLAEQANVVQCVCRIICIA